MNIKELENIINSSEHENEYWDFKKEWYEKNKKDELLRDIISFANTVHHEDCYLIIGVSDDKK
ncbi:MAG: putative DNA binding domain-containing protein [Firmicutes bacterium]|uniref:DNA binding domain-containing protein n=1 Tax=Candidatus Gallilactobacillus intestinavium TaxID=2840838 RepID=A0A9D9E551_9LACO|nr:putative DNA binding domain-containing protein [Candidatus Gallilactobacillus intestinavium]